MSGLPVKRMVLYKHGVGFFERYGSVGDSAQVELTFKKDEMNDVLKSLAAFPQGNAQVINVSYETPEDKQSALSKAPIQLGDNQALLDLLRSLRGRLIRLHGEGIDQAGTVLGIDANPDFDKVRLSLLSVESADHPPNVRTYCVQKLQSVEILDSQSGDDLRYILDLSRSSGDKRSVTVLLSQPNQELLVSYVAPTPTWRVSYRLVYTPDAGAIGSAETPATGKLLLQGWGIVDNQLDEDLDAIELTLIAGQPISFVYDLYTPKLIARPQVGDEERTVTGPVMFEEAMPMMMMATPAPDGMAKSGDGMMMRSRSAASAPMPPRRDLAAATQIQATGVARGELFQYDVSTPVSIKRGQSAMVPILGATIDARKEHLYNSEKVPDHPVVTITATNSSGLTLERGPVTVLEKDSYVGEAVIAFTPTDSEFFVPYAVDLGVKITPTSQSRERLVGLRFQKDYYLQDYYLINATEYQIENRNAEPIHLVIEQRIHTEFELFSTPNPFAQTAEYYRWRLTIPARGNTRFTVQERRHIYREEAIRTLQYQQLQQYLHDRFLDQATFDRLAVILNLQQQLNDRSRTLTTLSNRRDKLAKEQQEAAKKLQPLDREGDEGALRRRYVVKMQDMETESEQLAEEMATLEQSMTQLSEQTKALIAALGE